MNAAWIVVVASGGMVACIFAAFVVADIAKKHRRVTS